MKNYRLPALVLALAIVLCGCTGSPEQTPAPTEPQETTAPQDQDRTEQFGLAYDPAGGFNPYSCTTLLNRSVISLVYQGLFSVTSGYDAEPVLCKGYSVSSDLKTHTFSLENARFSNGASLTAQDVLASIRAARGSSVYGSRLQHITDLSVSDSGALVVTTDIPYENLPVLLDIPVVPEDQTKSLQPLGTGAYAFTGEGETLSLYRVQDWWSEYPPAIAFASVDLTAAVSPGVVRNEFEFGSTDLVCADPSAKTYVAFRCDYELWDCATGIMLYLGCNRGGGIFSNTAIRKGLARAIVREDLLPYYNGFAQAAYLPASPAAKCYDAALAGEYGFNPNVLKDALSAAGLYGSTAILLVDGDDPVRLQVANEIASQLESCGLNITVDAKTGEKYQYALEHGRFDLYLGQIRLSANFDLSPFFQEGGSATYGGMVNGSNYALCLAALENSGNYYDLHEAVMDSGQLCPLLFRTYAVYATRGIAPDLLPGLDNVFHTANSRQLSDAKS